MKKWWLILLLCLMLGGCADPAYETMSDVYEEPRDLAAREVALILPQEAVLMTPKEDTEQQFYLCKDFSLSVQTFSAGDLGQTLRTISGFERDKVSVLKLRDGDLKRYECVWVSAGESGDQLCRAVILDDGDFHYVLTMQAPAELSGEVKDTWQEIAGSFSLDIGP